MDCVFEQCVAVLFHRCINLLGKLYHIIMCGVESNLNLIQSLIDTNVDLSLIERPIGCDPPGLYSRHMYHEQQS